MASQLRPRPEVQVVDAAELDQAEVAVVVAERGAAVLSARVSVEAANRKDGLRRALPD